MNNQTTNCVLEQFHDRVTQHIHKRLSTQGVQSDHIRIPDRLARRIFHIHYKVGATYTTRASGAFESKTMKLFAGFPFRDTHRKISYAPKHQLSLFLYYNPTL